MKPRILVVEDEPELALGLRHNLAQEGYDVVVAPDGIAGGERAREGGWDLIILDVMLPGRSGFELLEQLRRGDAETPVLILSARSTELDKVQGLNLGADDYLAKPFGLGELLARVRARLRRAAVGVAGPEVLRLGAVTIDLGRNLVQGPSGDERLTANERALLLHLHARAGRVVSREELLNKVWGFERFPTTRTVDNHVARLRKKIEADPARPRHLLTVHGLGYRLEIDEPSGGSLEGRYKLGTNLGRGDDNSAGRGR